MAATATSTTATTPAMRRSGSTGHCRPRVVPAPAVHDQSNIKDDAARLSRPREITLDRSHEQEDGHERVDDLGIHRDHAAELPCQGRELRGPRGGGAEGPPPARRGQVRPRRTRRALPEHGRRRARQALPAPEGGEHAHRPAPPRHAVGRGPRLERRGPVPGLERHPQRRAASLVRGGRARLPEVPLSVEPLQRQHLRLSGAPDQLRARDPPRGPLRAQRHLHGPRRPECRREGVQLAERRDGAPGRLAPLHRSRLRKSLRGHAAQERRSAAGPEGGGLPLRRARQGGEGRRRALQAERALLLARLQEGLRRRHRHLALRRGRGA